MSKTADVLIIGAGPVGLMLANLLGQQGVNVLLVEKGETLIDYPRAVGIDDEALRAMQTAGLVDEVLPHTIPDQKIYMVNGDRQILSEVNPTTREFGWPRRNGFVQPLVDRVLLDGLKRFPNTAVRFSTEVVDLLEDGEGVVATTERGEKLRARYVVAAEGGSSRTRTQLGISFDGETRPSAGIVIDVANDPIGTPHAVFGGDPKRSYASIALPHGIRRWEFTLFESEDPSLVENDDYIHALLAPHVPDPTKLEIIRRRVYRHHARVAGQFKVGSIFLAGDAAHVMPVVGGQGWNSGIRDAFNLAWKLGAVINGACGDALLETYEMERMGHVKQMVAVSLGMAKEMTDHDPAKAAERDRIAANRTPEEREAQKRQAFKPQPKFDKGVVVHTPLPSFKTLAARDVPRMAGAIFPQPRVTNAEGVEMLLDDATGQGWRVLMWNNNPMAFILAERCAALAHLRVRLVQVVPKAQLPWARRHAPAGVTVIGDLGGEPSLQAWFDARPVGAVVVRPDHVVAAECLAQELDDVLARVLDAAHFCLPQQ
ncbi:3-(3-hydroxy-phenyl)propionate hydroxylase [Paraburkholderia atlantica]|uniref:3-(3-hydroxy-phenyl)propionate hydroxylase n=1 Tax=Paraburkholderia atlantica TaxID=2654982 RepID=A0A6I1Q078_PARAM|nr:bifunctional 3-(3-hydroxy-phenyl)propionate/3-hydroxycinnamic acid hydroxylase [Paraburkholderia atlantica]MBB5426054.1 3-(3-hydroxy-phenyl)propionate hydroxylase [Paraburkholderia atlantica]MPW10896.1 bifunctional 3-(3-hydroxy-phenyl)propionate/3-hydroxycinnamic acid hydroxylase [Paraburkholderia atlantica]NUY33534.1 bifunctional 3-(3-hydroxy-phenyl)propionate/3-hydroxycinnamic acid hydroxylase [Paraburkholderia atlantica]